MEVPFKDVTVNSSWLHLLRVCSCVNQIFLNFNFKSSCFRITFNIGVGKLINLEELNSGSKQITWQWFEEFQLDHF